MASPGPISVADESANYPYTTLKGPHAFRLLRFEAATARSENIACTMQEYDRNSTECPTYIALSYAWGDASNKKHILLDNLPVPVTANLHEALVHLRDVYPDITIWIDALCINQDSLRERGHQVAQMKEIYSEAEKVISWLGPSSEDTTPLFDAIRTFDDIDEAERTSNLQLDHEAHFRAFENFMARPYWSRAWVVQEMAVATDLFFMCGNDVLRSDYLLTLTEEDTYEKIDFDSLWTMWQMRGRRLKDTNLAMAFRLAMLKEVTEPRDQLYSILGLINEGAGQDIGPDYTISECAMYAKAIRAVNKDWSRQYLEVSSGMREHYDKTFKDVMDDLVSQVERCPDLFLLYEDLVQHCPYLQPSDSKSRPWTACIGCDLFGALVQICIAFNEAFY